MIPQLGDQKAVLVDPVDHSAGKERVLRGGAFNSPIADLRNSARDRFAKDRENTIGFRCVLPVLEIR